MINYHYLKLGQNYGRYTERKKRIKAFEIWCWRTLLKIPWTEKVKNEEVYQRMNKRKQYEKQSGRKEKNVLDI